MTAKYDLGFGNSVCVRKAFLQNYRGNMIVFTGDMLQAMDYPDRDGDPELIELTKTVLKRQTGDDYKYVVPTNGATGGVTIALRAMKQKGYDRCHTRNAPWYLRYPSMIKAAGMVHVDENAPIDQDSVHLIDLPSNPLNQMARPNVYANELILDGVYLNKVYTDGYWRTPRHDAMIGSYSKLLGLNGIRLGWVATNNEQLYLRMKELAIGEYCGLSVPSAEIVKRMLFNYDWQWFEARARTYLNYNREEWSKLERYFGDKSVDDKGMFYYGPTDKQCAQLLAKAGVGWTRGSALGTNDSFGRFNLGQDCDLVKKAVADILGADSI